MVEAYLFPTVDENRENFSWGQIEVESIREYAKKTFGWTKNRTDEIILPVVKRLSEKKTQQSIQNYFKITDITSRKDLKVSKRVRTALEQMSADPDAPIEIDDDVIEKKKPKKKPTKTSNENGESSKPQRKRRAAKTEPKDKQEDDNNGTESTDDPMTTSDDKNGAAAMGIVANIKPKPKPRRKRKATAEIEQTDSNATASTSADINASSIGAKKVVLPDNNAPIPQREMDKQIMEQNKLKAIEILKKTKMGKK